MLLFSRATAILAYLPQELLGTSFYEYFHEDDIVHLAECHRRGMRVTESTWLMDENCLYNIYIQVLSQD